MGHGVEHDVGLVAAGRDLDALTAAGLAAVKVGEVPPWMEQVIEAARQAVASECDVAYANTSNPLCMSCYEDFPCSKADLRNALAALTPKEEH